MAKQYIHKVLRSLVVVTFIVGGGVLLYYIAKVTYPFIVATAIAFFINPVVNFLENKVKIPRFLAVFVTIIFIIGIFAGFITLLITEIVAGTNYLATVVPTHIEIIINSIQDFIAHQLIPSFNRVANFFHHLDDEQQEQIIQSIQTAGQTLAANIGYFIQQFFWKLPSFISWIPNTATVLIFSLLATFFISKDWYKLTMWWGRFLPTKAKSSSLTVTRNLRKAFFGFIRAQATLISMTLLIVLIGLLILRVEYAFTIAIVIGIVDMMPYLGTGLVFVPWIIFEWITGNVSLAVGLTVLYTIIIVQRQLMEPKILSASIGLNPLATLISLFVGFKLVGFLGLLLGPVVLVVISTLHHANVFHDIWSFIQNGKG